MEAGSALHPRSLELSAVRGARICVGLRQSGDGRAARAQSAGTVTGRRAHGKRTLLPAHGLPLPMVSPELVTNELLRAVEPQEAHGTIPRRHRDREIC